MKRLSMTIAAVLVGACAGAQAIPAVPGQGSAAQPNPAGSDVAQLAIAALAKDLGIAPEAIQVDTVRAVEWRNSSLGCPKPGMAYLDVITPGHKVTLRANGQVYVVHEAKNRAFVCRQTRALGGITPQRELVFGPQMFEARRDLAARLGVPESEIQMIAAQEQTWEDAGLGCPEPGKSPPPGKVTGWVLTFEHAKRPFTYHTDLHRTIPCPAIASE
jgi:hypothetical protein